MNSVVSNNYVALRSKVRIYFSLEYLIIATWKNIIQNGHLIANKSIGTNELEVISEFYQQESM